MNISATMTTEGRTALITYLLNSAATPQTDKFYIKEFELYTGLSGSPSTSTVQADLAASVIAGGVFEVANRSEETGKILRLTCNVTTGWDSGGLDITGIGVIYEDESSNTGLLGYAIFDTGFEKIAGINLSFYIDLQM